MVTESLSKAKLRQLASEQYGEMIKAVVDIGLEILAVGGELHADAEALLLQKGSKQQDLWGVNIYPNKNENDRIVYSAFINIRPRDGNRSIDIKDANLKERIRSVIDKHIAWGKP